MADDLLHGAERGVDGAGADGRVLHAALPLDERDLRRGAHVVAAVHHERVELPFFRVRMPRGDARLRKRREVAVGDLLLPVGERLERREHLRQAPRVKVVAEVLEAHLERVLPGVLAEDQFRLLHADRFRRHDLVRLGLRQDAVLVDAAFVRERVGAHDGLARGDPHARDRGEQVRRAGDLLRVDARDEVAVGVASRAETHHDLLQRGVAGALADSADRALHLARPGADARERVGHGESEVVVAVRGHRHVRDSLHPVHDGGDERGELVGRGVPDRVGDVDDRRARRDGGVVHLAEEVHVRARGVLGGELHVAAEVAGAGDGLPYLPQAVGAGDVQLVLEVQVARGDERVDARTRRALDRRRRGLDVLCQRP